MSYATELEEWRQRALKAESSIDAWAHEEALRQHSERAIEALNQRDAARAEVERLRSDPRLAVPLDGPGSHKQDLAELRLVQAKCAALREALGVALVELDTDPEYEPDLARILFAARAALAK